MIPCPPSSHGNHDESAMGGPHRREGRLVCGFRRKKLEAINGTDTALNYNYSGQLLHQQLHRQSALEAPFPLIHSTGELTWPFAEEGKEKSEIDRIEAAVVCRVPISSSPLCPTQLFSQLNTPTSTIHHSPCLFAGNLFRSASCFAPCLLFSCASH